MLASPNLPNNQPKSPIMQSVNIYIEESWAVVENFIIKSTKEKVCDKIPLKPCNIAIKYLKFNLLEIDY